jgi:hypothetical protein
MPKLDAALAAKIVSNLSALPEDTQPKWGKMSVPQMRGHLRMVVEYTMGAGKEIPFKGNWKSRHIFRPLIISGLVAIPHNIKVPRQKDGSEVPTPDATIEELKATLDKYVAQAAAGKLSPRTHPFFGVLTPAQWQGFHAAHFKHHLLQFGAWS